MVVSLEKSLVLVNNDTISAFLSIHNMVAAKQMYTEVSKCDITVQRVYMSLCVGCLCTWTCIVRVEEGTGNMTFF